MPTNLDNYQQRIIDASFDGVGDYSDDDGFQALERSYQSRTPVVDEENTMKRVSNQINETKMIPMTLYTDSYTATQLMVLLEMIRYCMEKSGEGRADNNKEFSFNVHVKNRIKSDFIVSVGDEPMPALPYEKDVFIGH